jgi:HK97 family phage major capsid protein
MDNLDVQSAAETLARAFEDYKATNDERLNELERRGSSDVLHDDRLGRLDQVMTRLQDEVNGVKTALRRPTLAGGKLIDREASEHKQAFMRYIVKGVESEMQALQTKDLNVISDPNGGYMVPVEVSERIITRQFDTSPLRQIATVMTVNSEAVEMLRDTNEPDAVWVSELATRNDSNEGTLGRIRITAHELYAQPRATQKLLDDAVLNVEEWLITRISDRFARRENAAFVTGDGVAQPRGFASYTTQAVSDATRNWGVLEHVPTGVDGAFPASNPADLLITLMHRLRVGYMPGAAWLMPRTVAEQIRRFKENSTNGYIWQPGLQAGLPATLLGFPIYLAEDLPAPASGSLSIAFGNFKEGYTIVDRSDIRVLRDPYTAAPFVRFRCTKRVGGDVTNFEAIKFLRFAVS